MPLGPKSAKMQADFEKEYGDKEGKRVFYATLNKKINEGKPVKVSESRRLKAKRKNKRKAHRGVRR